MSLSSFAVQAAPPALITAYAAAKGLAALLNVVDPNAWASMARPDAAHVAALIFAITGKMDEGLEELGGRAEIPRTRPLD